ncbi:MAG: ATP-dependent DNA helicase RecG [Lactobacillaceae bacterium]|jgi:ATP-dependent DNA helicase RecG|nr:ATP-dependent DNA helicase RecG [Lactobacillaceae bacterium]
MRPGILFPLFSSISSLTGVGEKNAKLVSKLAGDKVVDLLWHLPYNIIDRTYSPALANAQSGKIITIKVKITEHIVPKTKKQPYKVICSDGTEEITLVFFKVYSQSIAKNLAIGSEKIISGKIEVFNNIIQMTHPDYIVPSGQINDILGLEPVYSLTAGLTNKFVGKICRQALARVPAFPEWTEESHKKSLNFPSFNEAIAKAHNPKTLLDLEPASAHRMRLAYDELLANQLSLAIVRSRIKKQQGRVLKGNGLLRKKMLDILPFNLTESQEKVLKEIFADAAGETQMHRLLQGDVGSGKTIVAFLAMLNAVECGAQAAIMAPTEILAKQHLETLAPFCEEIGVKIELLTGRIKGKNRKKILEELKDGKINILIGTHALFVEDVEFKNLAFVVVDEQHRFGVHQRLGLSNKGDKPDILVMTATPIPRTLVLTAYGDMEYSKIDQSPKGRKPVDTRVMPITKIEEIIKSLQIKIAEGKRAYWVCPLVEESEKVDLQAAINRYEILQKYFGNHVGLVHGKMKEKEKDEIMERFKKGKIKILVATTVIEVGVNVPEATIMIVEHAERFGLAQLHQLRGRVKRGYEASSCILLYSYPLSEAARARLKIMRETEDGFLIAEEDLKLRGQGELLGTKQSGFTEFKLADMSVHQNLLITADKDAKMILEKDINLKTPRGEALRILLYLFERDDAVKTYLAG